MAQEKAAEEAEAKATAEELRGQELEEMKGRLDSAFEAQLESERTIEMLRNKLRDEADSSEESSDCEHIDADDRIKELDDRRNELEIQLEAAREELGEAAKATRQHLARREAEELRDEATTVTGRAGWNQGCS